jgi:signal transduction histidine kinase
VTKETRSTTTNGTRGADLDGDAGSFPLAPGLLLFAPVALLGNEIGTVLRYPDIGSAVLYVPYAALVAMLVASVPRHWVWYIAVGLFAHFVTHWPNWSVSWVLFADVANNARALTAAVLLRRLFKGRPRLDSLPTLAAFVVSAAFIAPAVGATLGAANVVAHGSPESYWRPWSAWFLSNALTGLTILPGFVLAVGNRAAWRWPPLDRNRAIEALALAATLVIAAAVAFVVPTSATWNSALLFYAPLPVLIWAALRFGSGGASLGLTAVTFAATWGADRGDGPFSASSPDRNVLALQVFVLLTSLPVLCIAAISASRQRIVQLHRALLASVQEHVAILDHHGVILEVNDSWYRFTERPDCAPHQRVYVGNDYVTACRLSAEQGDITAARVLAGVTNVLDRQEQRFEIEYDDAAHHERYALTVEALAQPHGGAIIRRTNVTARRQAQAEIDQQRRQLSHLARVTVLGQLSGALAHELNQPLAAIGSNADAARRILNQRPTDYAELDAILTDILSANHRAAQVIRRLRALLDRGEARMQPLDTSELVHDVLELAHAELITRRVIATAVLAPNLPQVLGDRVQLQQVLLNLVLNASEAMNANSPQDRRLSLIATADARRNVQISVRDCGTGIPPNLIDRLFEPFVTTKPQGLGLGLSISRTIVAAHGGRLWAQNNTDRGATVHCLLVAAPVTHERVATSGNGAARHPTAVHA